MTLNATSLTDPAGVSQARFTAIATDAKDYADHSNDYVANEEDTDNILSDDEAKKTPGAGVLMAIAALGLAGASVMRRRRE